MLIVCPSCASEYTIDPGRLGSGGRVVRCAGCKETWFVTPKPQEAEEGEEAEPVSVPAGSSDSPVDDAAAQAEEPFSEKPERPFEAPEPEEYPASAAGDGLRAATRAARSAREPSRRFAAAGPLMILATLVIAGSALWGRAPVVRAVPATAALYASIGLPVNLRGLEFRAVTSRLVEDGLDTVLVVEGEIANISGRDAPVPPIEIGVRGAEEQMLYTWTNDPPRETLTASGTAPFRARLAAPPADARQVLVRFPAGRDGTAVASRTP